MAATRPAVILEVADTRKGIPPEIEPRLFDPFFSTKEAGTGLGLAIALRVVEKHGGLLLYQTQPNRGTSETAVEATKLGACEYLLKPFEPQSCST